MGNNSKISKIEGKLDDYIIPILKHLWKQKINTFFSCAGHGNESSYCSGAYLAFDYDFKFVNYLAKSGLYLEIFYNAYEERSQYIVRPLNLLKTRRKMKYDKLFRDRMWSIIAKYKG